MSEQQTRRLTCSCGTCRMNASTRGLPFPLQADWTPKTAQAAATLATTPRGRHAMVWLAHDTAMTGRAARHELGLKPVLGRSEAETA